MILLTGPNSTGKTYLAWSVYVLFRTPHVFLKVFRGLADEILASPDPEIEIDLATTLWPRVLEAVAENLANRLHLCFASERRSFASFKVSIRQGSGDLESLLERAGDFTTKSIGFRVHVLMPVPRLAIERDRPDFGEAERPIALAELRGEEKEDLTRAVQSFLHLFVWRGWPTCTLLPTERVAVDLFAKELSIRRTELLDRALEAQLSLQGDAELSTEQLVVSARDVGRYPWPIQDSLRRANDLDYYSRLESEFADLAGEIEALLGGTVNVSKEGAIGFKPAGKSSAIGVHLTSSVVKSLVSLVFYFRHGARGGDLLMIDGPELNLHPDNQRKIARVLARAVNRGLRVIMSTHSDHLLRELNNLVILSRDTESFKEIRAKHGYSDGELLDPSKVGVYLFKDGTAVDVPVEADGFEVESIEEEINRMNAISQEIYAALHE